MGNGRDPLSYNKQGWSENTVDNASPQDVDDADYGHMDAIQEVDLDAGEPTVHSLSSAVADLNKEFDTDHEFVTDRGVAPEKTPQPQITKALDAMQMLGEAIADKAVEMKGPLQERMEQMSGAAEEIKTNITDQAASMMEVVTGTMEQAKSLAEDAAVKTRAMAESAADQAKAAGKSIADTIKQHPTAAIMTGAGIGCLLMMARGAKNHDEPAKKMSPMHYPKSYAENDGSKNMKPIAIGALAIAAGIGLGLAMPESELERDLMGDTRDRLRQKAMDGVHDITARVKDITDSAIASAKANLAMDQEG